MKLTCDLAILKHTHLHDQNRVSEGSTIAHIAHTDLHGSGVRHDSGI
jgi:hypothetical protein